jgi:N4-(beta-N-acetylglucosaminyl)-L-asparaginase
VHPAVCAFLALSPKGEIGAAASQKANFQYAVAKAGKIELRIAKELQPEI